jgi:hypothetical protein
VFNRREQPPADRYGNGRWRGSGPVRPASRRRRGGTAALRVLALAGRRGAEGFTCVGGSESVSGWTATGWLSPQCLMIAAPSLMRMNLARRSRCITDWPG